MSFLPSASLQERIGFDPERCHYDYRTFPIVPSQRALEYGHNCVMMGISRQIQEYYSIHLSRKFAGMMPTALMVVHEAMQNAWEHGPGTPYELGVFLGDAGACFGVGDAGDYFRRAETKRIFESRSPLTRFDPEAGRYRCGVNEHIFRHAELIEVDTRQGVLFLGFSLDTLLRPCDAQEILHELT